MTGLLSEKLKMGWLNGSKTEVFIHLVICQGVWLLIRRLDSLHLTHTVPVPNPYTVLSHPQLLSTPDPEPDHHPQSLTLTLNLTLCPSLTLILTPHLTLILSDRRTSFEFGIENSKIPSTEKEPLDYREVPIIWLLFNINLDLNRGILLYSSATST